MERRDLDLDWPSNPWRPPPTTKEKDHEHSKTTGTAIDTGTKGNAASPYAIRTCASSTTAAIRKTQEMTR